MSTILRRRKLGRTSCREIAANSHTGIKVLRNDKPFPEGEDLVFRWGCTSNVPAKNVVNTAKAIHLVCNKTLFRRILDENGLCTPTYFNTQDAVEAKKFPYVVRPRQHAQGRKLFLCHNEVELQKAVAVCGPGYYINQYVKKTNEYRVFVVQGRVVCVAEKTPGDPEAVAWNVAQGGRFDNVRWDAWPLKVVRTAVEAFNLSGLDFGGVDVMVDDEGNAWVLEINSAPSLTSPYRQQCFAKAFDWIVQHGKEKIPLTKERGGYRKFVHPAVCDRAIV